MAKIKFTKGELKRQRDALQQFERYLPILRLKKQQLQLEIRHIRERLDFKIQEIDTIEGEINDWAGLLNEAGDLVAKWATPKSISRGILNIAGVDIPIFEAANFETPEYDLFLTPLWIDTAIEKIRQIVVLIEEEKIFKEQIAILGQELSITTQRVNLFEKVKIPECKENSRLIRIYLGDQQTNAVGRSKIAKSKIEKMVSEGVLV
ncbi:MAG: V-type ATP synthase subunit D [Candidatus Omnitrophica bacterium]|nr:V-type ATP synthase subunit D [Candidatus Omnitrophota bacterium]